MNIYLLLGYSCSLSLLWGYALLLVIKNQSIKQQENKVSESQSN